MINFTVTMGGLEQQLLGRVRAEERPSCEEQKMKLVEDVNANKKLLKRSRTTCSTASPTRRATCSTTSS